MNAQANQKHTSFYISTEVLFDNYATAGMGATNLFVQNIRAAEWVEITFGGRSHSFSLTGSSMALDAIQPYLR